MGLHQQHAKQLNEQVGTLNSKKHSHLAALLPVHGPLSLPIALSQCGDVPPTLPVRGPDPADAASAVSLPTEPRTKSKIMRDKISAFCVTPEFTQKCNTNKM